VGRSFAYAQSDLWATDADVASGRHHRLIPGPALNHRRAAVAGTSVRTYYLAPSVGRSLSLLYSPGAHQAEDLISVRRQHGTRLSTSSGPFRSPQSGIGELHKLDRP